VKAWEDGVQAGRWRGVEARAAAEWEAGREGIAVVEVVALLGVAVAMPVRREGRLRVVGEVVRLGLRGVVGVVARLRVGGNTRSCDSSARRPTERLEYAV